MGVLAPLVLQPQPRLTSPTDLRGEVGVLAAPTPEED